MSLNNIRHVWFGSTAERLKVIIIIHLNNNNKYSLSNLINLIKFQAYTTVRGILKILHFNKFSKE